MRTLAIDIETYSSYDLAKTGVYKYVEAPDFEILLFGYAYDGEEPRVIDLAQGEEIPEGVALDIDNMFVLKTAYNANFERTCLAKFFNSKLSNESRWQCTMAKASMLSLPLPLDACAKVLELPQQKDASGKALIRYFTMPCKPTKTNGQRTRNLPEHDLTKWNAFKGYCRQDVAVEQAIANKISFFTIPDTEKRLWKLDQLINDRGVLIDRAFVKNAIRHDLTYRDRLTKEAVELTNLDNPNSATQLKEWLTQETGEDVTSLKKGDVPALLESAECDVVKRVLNIRQELSKTSVKKYVTMMHAVCGDGRIRGLLQYYGANRTGRWAGRLVQVQNLPQNHLEDLDLARQLVSANDLEMLELCFGNVPDTLSQLIRTSFVAAEGHRFIVADFSAIEARVIAWLAGERWRLEVFATHGKIYEASASQMFKVPIETVTKGSALRQKGKVAELACIAKGQLVTTDKGLVPIELVTKNHLVFDGQRFVSHDGVIYKGVKKVITYDGLTATTDHLVWIEGQTRAVHFGDAAASGLRLKRARNGGKDFRACYGHKRREKMESRVDVSYGSLRVQHLLENTVDRLLQPQERKVKRLPKMRATSPCSEVVRSKANRGKATLHKPERRKLSQLWRERHTVQIQKHIECGTLGNSQLRPVGQIVGIRQDRQRRTLRGRQSALYSTRIKPSKQEVFETYDILNAGQNNRFTVSGVLVHNCGYQGGPSALITMGALTMGIELEELPKIIKQWRNANKKIVELWYKVQDATIAAVKGERVTLQHGLKFYCDNGFLVITLPSGRSLYYNKPGIAEGQYGEVVTYYGMNQTTKQWQRQETYGGKLVENIVQATARDMLADAMLRLDEAGYDIAMHVHDEAVLEMPEGVGSVDQVNKIMSTSIPWAKGLLLKADGYETKYYKKD